MQRGTSIASDIQGLAGKPSQMGGVDLSTSDLSGSDIVTKLGYETTGDGSGDEVPAQGAGSGGDCTISVESSNANAKVKCTSDDAPQEVTVTVDLDEGQNSDVITTSFSSS